MSTDHIHRVRILAVDDEQAVLNLYQDVLSSGENDTQSMLSELDALAGKLFGSQARETVPESYDLVLYHQGDEAIPFVGLFVSASLVKEQPELVQRLKELYCEGVRWVHENPEEAARYADKYLGISPSVFEVALSRTDFRCFSTAESRKKVQDFFGEILKVYPDLIGGKLPDEVFYQ